MQVDVTQAKIDDSANIEKKEIAEENVVVSSQESNKEEDTKEDPNWRAFREARKRDRAEKEAAERRAAEKEAEASALRAAMEAAFAKTNHTLPQRESNSYLGGYDDDETEDQRIEKKVQAALAVREAAAERARQEREQQEYPQRLMKDYPDFNALITADNLDYLEYHYPEVARPLKRQPDGYDKWADTYLAIKKFLPNVSSSRKDAVRADSNFNKPKSISSPQLSQSTSMPGSQILSDERKAANWERMQRLLKGVG